MKRKSTETPQKSKASKKMKMDVKKRKSRKMRSIKRISKKSKKGSSKLKKIIRGETLKIIHSERPLGTYQKNVLYNFPTVNGSTTTPLQNVVNQVLFGNSGGYEDANLATGTYTKLIDAVSVLFNGKAADFYTSTGNLSPSGVIIPDVVHKARYTFTNNTAVKQCLLIYETTPKEDRPTQDVYTTWNACNNLQVGGVTRGITYFGNRPELYSQFRDAYNILKKKMYVLKPGESFTYKMQSSAIHLKLDDWLPVGSTTPVGYRKGFTKELLVIQWNGETFGYPNSTSYMAGSWNVTNDVGYGIGVESREWFKMRCPENVDSTRNDDNVFCIFSRYFDDISSTAANTVVTPAITVTALKQ